LCYPLMFLICCRNLAAGIFVIVLSSNY